jgi:hypothetical protein
MSVTLFYGFTEKNIMNRVETSHYQRFILEEFFARDDLPLLRMSWRMESVLPPTSLKKVSTTKDYFKEAILDGGSLVYNRLSRVMLEECPKWEEAYPHLSQLLNSHGVRELYRYVWIWSEDGHIMKRGGSWFTSKDNCLAEGKKQSPSYCTFDGPGAPEATLCLESVCPCRVHRVAGEYAKGLLTIPCPCFEKENWRPRVGLAHKAMDLS